MKPLSVRDMEALARSTLDRDVYDFYAGGADDERTVRANQIAYTRLGLVPRVLGGAGEPQLETELLGATMAMPVLIAPTAFHQLVHPEGEVATARAAAEAGVTMITGMASTVSVEEVATARGAGGLWFQLYLQPDEGFTESVVKRAEAAGCSALVVTVDSPVFGNRERDLRHGFTDLPPGMSCPNMAGRSITFWAGQSWEHVGWLRSVTGLPLVLKGIAHPEDARLALGHGIDALIVSNHGGRQLDTVPAAIDLLPAVADAVGGAVPVLLDGGITRGTDIVKALALGATAVAVGRPVLWGLAVDGQAGVVRVLDMLRSELERALTLCGCGSPHDATRDLVRGATFPKDPPC